MARQLLIEGGNMVHAKCNGCSNFFPTGKLVGDQRLCEPCDEKYMYAMELGEEGEDIIDDMKCGSYPFSSDGAYSNFTIDTTPEEL